MKILGISIGILLILFIALIFFIRSPWGQGIIVNKATTYLQNKTGAEVSVGKLFITFSGNVSLEEFYISDIDGDTLVYSKNLEAGISFLPLIQDGSIHVSKFNWEGLTARIKRPESTGKFNFEYLIEAFSSTDEATIAADSTATDSASLNISLSPVTLKDFDITYLDEVSGIEAQLKLGDFELAIPTLDLESYVFGIKSISLEKSSIQYKQTKPFPASEETEEESILPIIRIENLSLSDITLDYDNPVDRQLARVKIGELTLQIPEIDLSNQNVEINQISLSESNILYHDFSTPDSLSPNSIEADSSSFTWPNWNVDLKALALNNNQIEYKTKDQEAQVGVFNPEVILLENLTLEASDIYLADESASFNLENFHFLEASGFELKDLILALKTTGNETDISRFFIQTNKSLVDSKANLTYESIQQLIRNPELAKLDLEISDLALDVRDSYFFAPELVNDTLIQELAKFPFLGDLSVKGNLSELEIPQLNISWDETEFQAKGSVTNALIIDSLFFDFPEINFKTNRGTINRFVSESDYGIQLPEQLDLQANARGTLEDLLADLDLLTDLGEIKLAARYQNLDEIAFDVALQLTELQLGVLLKNPDLDTLSLDLKAKGNGTSIYDLNASLESDFEQLNLYGSDYSGLQLNGDIINGSGDISLFLDSDYLNFDLLSSVALDSVNSKVSLALDLKGADFYELGISSKESRARLKLDANFEGNLDDFNASVFLHDGLVLHDKKNYPTGQLNLQALVKPDSTSVTIDSKLAKGFIETNTNPSALAQAIENHFLQYLGQKDSAQVALDRNIVMNMDISIFDDPILGEVLFQGLEQLDSGKIKLSYLQDLNSLTASVDFPYIDYSGTLIDNLGLDITSNSSNLNFDFGFQGLASGPLKIGNTSLTGELEDSRINFEFNSFEEETQLYNVAYDIGLDGDTLSIHIDPEDLILNKNSWTIPASNQVLYSENSLSFRDFSFSQNGQELSLRKNIEGFTDENIAILFQNFRLSTFTSLLNPEEIIAGGKLNGQLVVENPFGAIGLMGNLKIDSLQAVGVPLGNLSLDATAKNSGDYILALKLRDGGIDLDMDGEFVADESGGEFNLTLDLLKAEMTKIAALSQDQILEASGYLEGKVSASGKTSEPKYQGEFQFHETSFVPAQLSTKYLLSDEKITLDNDGVYFNQLTVRDADDNKFTVDGEISTSDLTNPRFDLNLVAKNFMVVNSTNIENELLYGRGTIDADVSIKGNLNLPIVKANLNIKENTDLTFIIPDSQLDLVERDGVVIFVNKENPDDFLTSQTEENTTAFSGFDIQALLTADPKAKFKVVIDPKTGDNLLLSGSADLQMDINPNGRITLSGAYEITEGHYEMSLYNLISKKFLINPGSRITWNGDPMDANLDIRAIYEVKTPATELMSSQITGSNQDTKSQYKTRLPFLVYLNVAGELLKPEISFALDMPENDRGALGGSVYSQVLQLNEQDDELNKQVFSLLVLNRFFPSQGSDGSSGGAEAIARNSASQILSSQMNALSSKLFGDSGFQVGFDFDSYQDYQSGSGQNRTDLNINAQQSLFNDRLVVEVGSQVDLEGSSQNTDQANSLLANISIEYMLTDDGRWRIKAFRKNQFESIIDGQLVVTGAGLIFNREFNGFRELWKTPVQKENKTNPIDELKEKQQNREEDENK
ncbi:translocation/assembly module TamB domain-containing protein [Algoriphagus marinus]|uniref:translocation/assembly module TamB domain-containing protein n=1 Tax=Algoriphagus marinus TaxID=1925762 RepID=UPI000AA5CE4B|nr:translocation/assembly module TamB domain-containing protein [Algoriphagus marinus]